MNPEETFRIDDSRMPVRLGSALRTPSYSHRNWGIPGTRVNRAISEDLYATEWESGGPAQMEYVIEAISRTGLGNYSHMLRDAAAEVVLKWMSRTRDRVNILELGAGISTIVTYEKLLRSGIDVDRIWYTMVEPSKQRLEDAVANLENMGLQKGRHFVTYVAKDTDASHIVEKRSQNIIVSVAQIHHHAWLDVPVQCLYAVTKPNGYAVIADWHCSMWEHPNRVFRFLQEFEWETKEGDLGEFARMFPKALEESPVLSELDEASNKRIRSFWRDGWAKVRAEALDSGKFDPRDDIFMLEGHRPVERQNNVLMEAGYRIEPNGLVDQNPLQLLADSRILAVTVGSRDS